VVDKLQCSGQIEQGHNMLLDRPAFDPDAGPATRRPRHAPGIAQMHACSPNLGDSLT